MEYYTRNFHTKILPYHILDVFIIYDEAESFNEELYEYLLNKEKIELLKMLEIYSDYKYKEVFSYHHTASEVALLSMLPTDIEIPDMRVFLLGGVSREVYEQIKKEKDKQDALVKDKLDAVEARYNHDSKIVPKHWLEMYNIEWQEAELQDIEYRGQDIILRILDAWNDEFIVELINGLVLYSEEEIIASWIIFAETLLKDSKLVLNVLGYDNEFTIEADDVIIINNGFHGGIYG